ncbi:MAG: DUF3793 family protein [bacterium]|nr:DUF3793 family protein [bacterium]
MIPDYLSAENEKQKELILTYYLAPVILKMKPASLLAFSSRELIAYEELLNGIGMKKVILDEYRNKSYVLFYQEDMITEILENKENQKFLETEGYHNFTLEQVLYRMEVRLQRCHRLTENNLFPHEIGILLGYPLQDVIGYIKNQGKEALASGYWKVYSNVIKAKNMFLQYDEARKAMLQYVTTHSLLEFHQ